MKKKFLLASLFTVASAMAVGVGIKNTKQFFTVAEQSSYSLNLGGSARVSEDEIAAGSFTRNTALGNPVSFALSSDSLYYDNGLVRLAAGAGHFLENKSTSPIQGLTRLVIGETCQAECEITVTYGTAYDSKTHSQSYRNNKGAWDNDPITINFENPVNFFRIETLNNVSFYIKSLEFTYSCTPATEAAWIEYESNDMIGKATDGESEVPSASFNFDFNCTDVCDPTLSGRSLKLSCDSTGTGWPSMLLNLDKSYDFTNSDLVFKAKFETAHKWVAIKMYETEGWGQVVNEIGLDAKSGIQDGEWTEFVISNATLVSKLISGKSLADIKLIRLIVNFDEHNGNNQAIYFDEMHMTEMASTSNMEMLPLDVGQCFGATVSYDYKNVRGSSTTSRRFTFENVATHSGDGDAYFMTFSPEDFWGKPDCPTLGNGTLSFDIKLNNAAIDENTNPYKHQVVIKLVDPDWNSKSAWIDLLPNGKWGYTWDNSDNGWFHFEKDLSSVANLAYTTGTIRLYIGLFLDATAKANTVCVLDNISFAAKA